MNFFFFFSSLFNSLHENTTTNTYIHLLQDHIPHSGYCNTAHQGYCIALTDTVRQRPLLQIYHFWSTTAKAERSLQHQRAYRTGLRTGLSRAAGDPPPSRSRRRLLPGPAALAAAQAPLCLKGSDGAGDEDSGRFFPT